jgi:hypothetical protein
MDNLAQRQLQEEQNNQRQAQPGRTPSSEVHQPTQAISQLP